MDTRSCPFCAEEIKRKAVVCRFCGRDVDPLYVDNPYANKQIIKVLYLHKAGNSFSQIAGILNRNMDFYLEDNGDKRPWTDEDLSGITVQFDDVPAPKVVGKIVEKIRSEKPTAARIKSRRNLVIFAAIIFVLIVVGLSTPDSSSRSGISTPSTVQSSTEYDVVGSWYDDVGSPGFMDATFTILKRGDSYYLFRKNGDGSTGKYPLRRDRSKFVKLDDKFGAYYVISGNRLDIYDRNGFIRTARKK